VKVSSDVPYEVKRKFLALFKQEYEDAERPEKPETEMKLKLELTNTEPFHFGPRRLSLKGESSVRANPNMLRQWCW